MTKLLEQAFVEVSRLPEAEQEAFAAWILDELVSERCWSRSLAESADAIMRPADETLAEHRAGQTGVPEGAQSAL